MLTAYTRMPEGAHQRGHGAADGAEPEDGADAAAQLARGQVFVEDPAPQLLVLDEEPLGEREHHGQDVLGHGLRPAADVAGHRDAGRHAPEGHVVQAGGEELQEQIGRALLAAARQHVPVVVLELAADVPGEQRVRAPERVRAPLAGQLAEVDE